ncbi:MAG: VanZ family protein [Thermodesulfobacteriota bacterium]|nr:VanZ family protein [Thermodesulfobacteriota bacterium]
MKIRSKIKKSQVLRRAVLVIFLVCMPWAVLSPATNPPAQWADSAHIAAMAILSMLAWASFTGLWRRVGAVLFVFAYSALMEFLQHFSPIRTGTWEDVWVNGRGILIGLVCILVLRMVARRDR